MPDKKTIIIVDDHNLFRKGIKSLLDNIPTYEIIGEASNGKDFLDLLDKQVPDVVLTDISMPIMDGIEATRIAVSKYPNISIIALSMYGDEEYYHAMIDAGVKGFILKDSAPEELEAALKAILNGENYFSQSIIANVIKHFNTNKKNIDKISETANLTLREKEVLEYLCNGLSTNEIAEKLYLSTRTVERHRANLLLKTDTKNAVSLVIYAIKHKLITV